MCCIYQFLGLPGVLNHIDVQTVHLLAPAALNQHNGVCNCKTTVQYRSVIFMNCCLELCIGP